MPRPKRKRKIFSLPQIEGFKPFGTDIKDAQVVKLLFEEYEAIKLADYQNLTQDEAAKKMNISRPTFTRIYDKARKTIAEALVEGKIIKITGGDIDINDEYIDDKNVKVKYQMGVGGFCICLKCEIRQEHKRGKPCNNQECPKCGEKMLRENSFQYIDKLKDLSKIK